MNGIDSFKIMDAYLLKEINNFKNAKQIVLKNNAAIWFNKICRIHLLTTSTTEPAADCRIL
jgi:hypothetical protein